MLRKRSLKKINSNELIDPQKINFKSNTMSRPSATEYGAFYQTYINYTSGKDYSILVQQYQDRIIESWSAIPLEKINYAYAPDKWTIRQMLQHVIDTERIFAYRALAISRKEPAALLGFDENEYAKNAPAANRNWKEMIQEWRVVRQSTNLLFSSFTEEQIKAKGTASGHPISVNALGFIIFGHALHHLHILKERYDI
ncbi:MAG: DinB family protein [Chitinophagaceae bacterium]|nr:MAG: DinB family protein [Chitinophagaceae bacterium]